MNWVSITLYWYLLLLLLGLFFMPITRFLFRRFFDLGYPFAKAIGILVVSYTVYIVSLLHIGPFTGSNTLLIILVYAVLNGVLFKKFPVITDIKPHTIPLLIFEEFLFLGCLIGWVYVRGQEPSLHGLEKFMDFGFINSALKSPYFPPTDMWLAGKTINYYYFGHITGAVLTKISQLPSAITYNLLLATIFALGVTQTFSLAANIVYHGFKKRMSEAFAGGILGTFLVNFSGNLHTIYLFTKGYEPEKPVPFWQILSSFNPLKYWYPNATRFIPFTIHEFPLYSYVVADLHGHVFDIPFVLLTIALLFLFVLEVKHIRLSHLFSFKIPGTWNVSYHELILIVLLGFLASTNYMTNAFDGGIYLLLSMFLFVGAYGVFKGLLYSAVAVGSFVLFNVPFSAHFDPFVSGIGVNCAPQFLTQLKQVGPFLFEAGNCQSSTWWMLLTLWGFFIFNFIWLLIFLSKKTIKNMTATSTFMVILFSFGVFLIIIPEFFYIKDIYPTHFRANTMFKLGYQAFMMMGVASAYTFIYAKKVFKKDKLLAGLYLICFIPLFLLVALYPIFAVRSYYGNLNKTPQLSGTEWLKSSYPEYHEIISYLNTVAPAGIRILEAPGDSYTDFDVVSSYTGLQTIVGWGVHQWLWRGSYSVVAELLPIVERIYTGTDKRAVLQDLRRFEIRYVVVGPNERSKYSGLNEALLQSIGKAVVRTRNGKGTLYEIPY